MQDQIRKDLARYESYGSTEQWNRQALPHLIEVIYHLYKANIHWWEITNGPITAVADLLAKFTYTDLAS